MPRTRRSYLPGVVFHLTARTQDGRPRFRPSVRSRIAEFIGDAVRVSDARLLAYAVMSNHLHVVLQQGSWPLGDVMQPALRRTALLVHVVEGTQGHVFERAFHDRACLDPYYVRNAIVYVHLNPVRAGMVDDPADFRWSSHACYAAASPAADSPIPTARVVDADTGLRLFGADPDAPRRDLVSGYLRYVDWRMERDRVLARSDDPATSTPEPDEFQVKGPWGRLYAPLFPTTPIGSTTPGANARGTRRDLRDVALRAFEAASPARGVALDHVRSGRREPEVVRIRRHMVLQLDRAGHRGCDIARFMRVTNQCVSAIITRARRERALPSHARPS